MQNEYNIIYNVIMYMYEQIIVSYLVWLCCCQFMICLPLLLFFSPCVLHPLNSICHMCQSLCRKTYVIYIHYSVHVLVCAHNYRVGLLIS